MVYSSVLQVRKLIRSLLKAWKIKAAILKDGDLQNITYDELYENLMTYEQNYINSYLKEEKKKFVTFNAKILEEEEELDKSKSDGMTLITRGVRQMLRQRRQH